MAEVGLQDGLGFDDVFWFAIGMVAVVTLVRAFLHPIIKGIKEDRVARNLEREEQRAFRRDFYGTEAEPGRDKVPGVMERLNSIDGELKRNGGSTVKDAVFTTKRNVQMIGQILNKNNDATRIAFERAGIEPPMFDKFPDPDDHDQSTKEQ